MLATLRRPGTTLSPQVTAFPLLARFGPTAVNSRFLRTPRHARSAAARARTQSGDGGSPPIQGSAVEPQGDDGLRRTRTSNPRELVSHLNDYVVGQERAKKILAVAVYNHYTRLNSLAASTSLRPSTSPDDPGASTAGTWVPYDPTPQESKLARDALEQGNSDERRSIHEASRITARAEVAETENIAGEQTEPTSATIKPKPKSHRGGNAKGGKHVGVSGGVEGQQWFKHSATGKLMCFATIEPYDPQKHGEDPTLYDSGPHVEGDDFTAPYTDETGRLIQPHKPLPKDKRGDKPRDRDRSKPMPHPISILPLLSEAPMNPHDLKEAMKRREAAWSSIRRQLDESSPRARPRPSTSDSSTPIPASEVAFEKSNVLLLGPTGSGKSLLARTLARAIDVPFVSVEATSMTSAGYVGEDVESAVARLVEAADGDVEKAARGIIFIDEIDKISSSGRTSKDVGGEGVQQALLKMLEGTLVNVSEYNVVEGSNGRGGGGLFGMVRKGPSREQSVDTTNILFICAGAFVGLEKLVQSRLSKRSIGFTSRIAPTPPRSPLHSSTSQTATTTTTTPSVEDLSHLLDEVEPSDLVSFGLIPEFIGRLPITAALKSLTESDLLRILTEPKNALVRQYQELFNASGVELKFTTRALKAIAKQTVSRGTGARGLRRLMENVLLDAMHDAPQSSIRYVLVTERVVEGREPAGYFSRAERWRFEQAFSDEEASISTTKATGSTTDEPGQITEAGGSTAEQEAEEREREKVETVEKRRRKVASS